MINTYINSKDLLSLSKNHSNALAENQLETRHERKQTDFGNTT